MAEYLFILFLQKKNKMKYIYIVPALLLSVLFTACNSNQTESNTNWSKHYEDLYERALKMEDNQTAVVALNGILMYDSSQVSYKDSLIRMYLKGGLFNTGLPMGLAMLKDQPDNDGLRELIAEAQGMKGEWDQSIINFSKLYKRTKDVRYLYKMAIAESNSGNQNALVKRLDQILADSSTARVEFPDANTGTQLVDIKAAANLLRAQIYFNANDLNTGAAFLQKALIISPDFRTAQMLMSELQQYKRAGKSGAPSAGVGSSQATTAEQKKALEEARYQEYLKSQKR
ncbi:MAG: tetratricopeptide (TPR) repeat protein [Bacteroidia bacterium]|jgi:tetratricopeptide (TPR) repeat protein